MPDRVWVATVQCRNCRLCGREAGADTLPLVVMGQEMIVCAECMAARTDRTCATCRYLVPTVAGLRCHAPVPAWAMVEDPADSFIGENLAQICAAYRKEATQCEPD